MTTILKEKLETKARRLLRGAEEIVAEAAGRAMSEAEEDDVEFALSRRDELLKRAETLVVRSEPDPYAENSAFSWIQDVARAVADRHGHPLPDYVDDRRTPTHGGPARRLARYAETRRSEFENRDLKNKRQANLYGAHFRDLELVTGAGLEFAPPTWLLDRFASVARSAAPLLDVVPSIPLPGGCTQVNLPRITVAGDVMPEQWENVTLPTFWDETDQISTPVAMIAGQMPMSLQLWERGANLDQFVTKDFGEDFAAIAEGQIVNGTGTNGQVLGWLNVSTDTVDDVPGAGLVNFTSESPTPTSVVAAIAQAASLVGNVRKRPASLAVMTPERFHWLTGSADGTGDVPMERVGTGALRGGDTGPWGPIAGLPTYLDMAIPQTLGDGAEDAILVVRSADSLWLQSDPQFTVIVDTANAAANLGIYLQYHAYVALFSARYPSSIATVQGSGLDRSDLWS